MVPTSQVRSWTISNRIETFYMFKNSGMEKVKQIVVWKAEIEVVTQTSEACEI